jgi:hemerythrin-like domain-containing protein
MKRNRNLHPLSWEHHTALTSVVLIRRQIESGASRERLERIASEFAQFHKEGLLPHFRHEEEWVLPRFLRHVPEDHPMVLRLLTDHVALHAMVYLVGCAAESGDDLTRPLSELADRLEAHIRFEERELFPRVEATLSATELDEIGRALHEIPSGPIVIPGGDGSRVSPAPQIPPSDF